MKKLFRFVLQKVPRPWLIRMSYWIRPILATLLRGKRYTDPIDNKSFSRFLPYGYGAQRDNVLSPSTLSLERHRLLWLYLERETSFFNEPASLLHFAPEQAFYKRFREMDHLTYTTTDLNSPLADVEADICELPFADNSYDWILCNHVLEHIPNDLQAMRELYRVLKPGGTAILQVPLDNDRANSFEDDSITDRKKRAEIFGQYDHVRIYGMDYFDRLASVGFRVSAVDYTRELQSGEVTQYCLSRGELIPVCFK
ncbi:class I SAM-dependent methyltransferase [Croceiramulus getboli]|nr:class I SAM-dependent methyltransferase [Flavobacteriaceae bacterium YJPT1-3]